MFECVKERASGCVCVKERASACVCVLGRDEIEVTQSWLSSTDIKSTLYHVPALKNFEAFSVGIRTQTQWLARTT